MNYEEFKEALIAAANDPETTLRVTYEDGRIQMLHVNEKEIRAPEQYPGIAFLVYTWDYLEQLVDSGEWQNYSDGNATIMEVQGYKFRITAHKVTPLESFLD
jgi:DUF971 family protein